MEAMANVAAPCVTMVHTLIRSIPIMESKLLPLPLVLWTTMGMSQHLSVQAKAAAERITKRTTTVEKRTTIDVNCLEVKIEIAQKSSYGLGCYNGQFVYGQFDGGSCGGDIQSVSDYLETFNANMEALECVPVSV